MGGLYKCDYSAPDGAKGSHKLTAKSEADARARVSKLKPNVHIMAVTLLPPGSQPVAKATTKTAKPPATPVKKPATPTPKPNSKLEKLLYRQNDRCFFCGKTLTKAEASVEHLQPKSAGGKNDDGNVVACCIALNRTLGDMSLKEKFAMVLKKAGHFTCPASTDKVQKS